MGDPAWHDPVMAGWWMWGQSCWIGSGWCSGDGAWTVGDDGRIVKRGRPGVKRQLPFLTADGRGVNRPQAREEGVRRKLPFLSADGKGVNHPNTREEGVSLAYEYHPMTMPELRRWFAFLSARLRHVRILNGDWSRAVTNGALKTLPVRQGDGMAGVFLDPPYADTAERRVDIYTHDDLQVAHAAREWALKAGTDPKLRIVFAGFAGEHGTAFTDAGWREVEWFKTGFLKGGMGNVGGTGNTQMARERLWLSPHCQTPEADRLQGSLFGGFP